MAQKKRGKNTKKQSASKKKVEQVKKDLSQGIGDSIEKVTKALGIKKAVDLFSKGKDCGCEERKQKLNAIFPYKIKPECMTENEYNAFKEMKAGMKKNIITAQERNIIASLHARLFRHKLTVPCSCNKPIWKKWLSDLNTLYGTY